MTLLKSVGEPTALHMLVQEVSATTNFHKKFQARTWMEASAELFMWAEHIKPSPENKLKALKRMAEKHRFVTVSRYFALVDPLRINEVAYDEVIDSMDVTSLRAVERARNILLAVEEFFSDRDVNGNIAETPPLRSMKLESPLSDMSRADLSPLPQNGARVANREKNTSSSFSSRIKCRSENKSTKVNDCSSDKNKLPFVVSLENNFNEEPRKAHKFVSPMIIIPATASNSDVGKTVPRGLPSTSAATSEQVAASGSCQEVHIADPCVRAGNPGQGFPGKPQVTGLVTVQSGLPSPEGGVDRRDPLVVMEKLNMRFDGISSASMTLTRGSSTKASDKMATKPSCKKTSVKMSASKPVVKTYSSRVSVHKVPMKTEDTRSTSNPPVMKNMVTTVSNESSTNACPISNICGKNQLNQSPSCKSGIGRPPQSVTDCKSCVAPSTSAVRKSEPAAREGAASKLTCAKTPLSNSEENCAITSMKNKEEASFAVFWGSRQISDIYTYFSGKSQS